MCATVILEIGLVVVHVHAATLVLTLTLTLILIGLVVVQIHAATLGEGHSARLARLMTSRVAEVSDL